MIIDCDIEMITTEMSEQIRERKESVRYSDVCCPFDADVLADLKSILGERELAELLMAFSKDLNSQVQLIFSALSEGDFSKVRSLAHRIKGGSAQVGAMTCAKLATDLEKFATKNGGYEISLGFLVVESAKVQKFLTSLDALSISRTA